ncbi:MAG: hypothetical protein ACR2JV_05775 [Gaiellales bacterium]
MTGHGHGQGHGHAEVHGPRWLSILVAVVLGTAAVFSGITAWHAQVLSGHSVEYFTLSTQAVNDANASAQDAERAMSGQRQLFIDYSAALDAGNEVRASTILGMMSANTRTAIDWWRNQPKADQPMSPFVSANPQWDAPGVVIDAQTALERSNEYLHEAERYLNRSHTLEFFAALLTVAFLAGGLTGVFDSVRAKLALVSVSVVVLVGCLIGTVVYW